MKNIYFFSFILFFKFFFFYVERINIVCLSNLGTFKIKYNSNFFFYNNNNIMLFKIFLLNLNKKLFNYNNSRILLQYFLSKYFISIFTGFRGKFKINGRGYKLYKKNNNLIFKLGYSHLIFKTLDFCIYLKKKEKKKIFYTLISLYYNKLYNVINIFVKYKLPNIYSKRGIFNNTTKILFKIGKANMI